MLNEQQAAFVDEIVKSILKGKTTFNMGVINGGMLYLMVNGGLLYETDISDVVPPAIGYYFLDDIRVPFNPLFKYATNGINNLLRERELCLINKYKLVYHNPDITDNSDFVEMMNAKSADGAFRVFIPLEDGNTFMYLTKGMFSLTKSDICGLSVFSDGSVTNIARFEIYKKKTKRTIYLTFAFLNMIPKGDQTNGLLQNQQT